MIPIKYNLRSLSVRRTTSIATGLGIALVVFVMAASMMLSQGVRKTLQTSGSDDVAIVLRKGSDAEIGSAIEEPNVGLIASKAGIAKDSSGAPQAVGEIVVVTTMEKLGANGVTNVLLRGVPEKSLAFRKRLKIVAGRTPKPGNDEVMVGSRIRGRFRGLELDQSFELRKNRSVRVVGVFEDGGSSIESEVWADIDTIRTAFGRQGAVSSVRVRLESPSKFDPFEAEVASDKRLGLGAMRETTFLEKQSEGTSTFISVLGTMISVFFAVGAMIGAMNTMYAAVANRQREIGTLRALGFSRTSILVSFVLEALALALAGGGVGVAAALALGSVKISMMNFASWSELVIGFEPTTPILGGALAFAGIMGLLGGFLPALRASRTSPIKAMRA